MTKLKMKSFGNKASNTDSDFSHLENNPNFKSEEVEGNQEATEEVVEDEVVDNSQSEDVSEESELNTEESVKDEEVIIDSGDEKPDESSLKKTDNLEENQDQVVVTDELLYQKLSEKLDREVNSLDDLTTQRELSAIENDEDLKAIFEWKEKTGRPIQDFFKYQKDYSKLSDLEVAREFLQIEYPSLSLEQIDLELEDYQQNELDTDRESAKRNLELVKYATKGREVLGDLKAELSEPSNNILTPEIKEQLSFIDNIKNKIKEDKISNESYNNNLVKASKEIEKLSLKLSDDLSIDFNVEEGSRSSLPTLINEMPHWRNEDGSWNHKSIIEDGVKIQNFDKMIQLAYEQGLNSGADSIIKNSKNSTLGERGTKDSEQGLGKKKPKIDGLDKMFANQGLKIKRFG